MPMEVYTDTPLVSITGPVAIVKDPKDGTNGSLTVAGAIVASSTLGLSGVLTAATGITVTAGGLTVTAGGLTVTAGGLTVTAGGITISAGGLTVTGGASIDQLYGGMSASAVATSSSGTIASNVRHSRVSPAAAVTAVVLATGTQSGQTVVVDNRAAGTNTVTFAASSTSNVAGGTGVVISGLTNRLFVWDGSLWN